MILFAFILLLILVFGTIYQYFRTRMGQFIKYNQGNIEIYKYKTLLRLFLAFVLIPLIPIAAILIFCLVYNLDFPENNLQFCIILLAQAIFSFAIGIYFTSIIIELYVPKSFKVHDDYRSLRIAIKFFHGPVSHVVMYMGICLYCVSFAFFPKFKFEAYSMQVLLAAVIGLTVGLILGKMQKLNMTWKYQFPFFILYFFMVFGLLFFGLIELKNEFTVFNIGFIFTSLSYLLYKNIRAKLRGEENLYSESNWRI